MPPSGCGRRWCGELSHQAFQSSTTGTQRAQLRITALAGGQTVPRLRTPTDRAAGTSASRHSGPHQARCRAADPNSCFRLHSNRSTDTWHQVCGLRVCAGHDWTQTYGILNRHSIFSVDDVLCSAQQHGPGRSGTPFGIETTHLVR